MATKLDKDLTRESTVNVSERAILITLTADQKISFKLKGMKSGIVTIDIKDLYAQLAGIEPTETEASAEPTENPIKQRKGSILLEDLRASNMIATLDYATKVKFDSIITDLINK